LTFCFVAEGSLTQNIRGFIERLLRAAPKVLGSRMQLSEERATEVFIGLLTYVVPLIGKLGVLSSRLSRVY